MSPAFDAIWMPGPLVMKKLCFGEVIRNVYMSSKAPFVGIYLLFRPALLIRDPDLGKRILVTDFEYFHDRGLHYDEENDPVGAFLLAMPGQKWKIKANVHYGRGEEIPAKGLPGQSDRDRK